MITAIRRATATIARFIPRWRAIFMPQALSHDHLMVRVSMTARLALEMRDAVRDLSVGWARRGQRLGFGIRMAQGYATLGRIGFEDRFDCTAIGAVINLAARLCAEAADGQVLVSGRLAAAAEAVAVIEELGERELRGMARPVAVANLQRLK